VRIFTLIRDLFDAPVSRTGAWRILNQTYRQMACSGQDVHRQSEVSQGRKTPISIAATAALTRSRAISTWLSDKVNSWRSTASGSDSIR